MSNNRFSHSVIPGTRPMMTAQAIKEMIAGALHASRHKSFFEFMQQRACFSEHTLFNRILIWFFHCDAALVAPITAWNRIGRYVNRGEKGFPLIFPIFGQGKTDFNSFRTETVFDVSQTHGEDVSDTWFNRPNLTPFPFREAITTLEDYARGIGDQAGENADSSLPRLRRADPTCIAVSDEPAKFFSLIHEIVRIENHTETSGSVFTKALECQGTVYVIGTMLGLPFYESTRLSYLDIPMSAMSYESVAIIERMQQRIGKVIKQVITKQKGKALSEARR